MRDKGATIAMAPTSGSKAREWAVDTDQNTIDDPLLGSLIAITKLMGQPKSADALRAGLPLQDHVLTPRLLPRAARRAGFSAQILRRPLNKISSLVLPAILLLHEGQACVLLGIDAEEGRARVLLPETGMGEQELNLAALDGQYTGYAAFLRPEHHFDARAPEVLASPARHWFWGTLARSWRIYRDVLVASFLINLFALASPLFIMNVYDRVVPNNAVETLWVLAAGVVTVYVFDLLMRALRGYFIDMAGKRADIALSATLFERVMGIRMDARPNSVGAFANNLSEFESVRNFITSTTVTTLIDLPFVILFVAIIALVGGSLVYAVTYQRQIINNAFWWNAKLFNDPFPIHFGVGHGIDQGDVVVHQLRHVFIAGGNDGVDTLLSGDVAQCADHIISFHTLNDQQG